MARKLTESPRDRKQFDARKNTGSHRPSSQKRAGEGSSSKKEARTDYLKMWNTSSLVKWIKDDWFVIVTLIGIFFLALFLRSYFYYDIAVDPPYPDYEYVLSGNDPYYHKRVIDHVQSTGGHLYRDDMLNYPVTARNPYPPIYDWSVAVTGMVLGGITGTGTEDATWIVILFAPAFWGALIVIPVYFLTRNIWGKKPALLAAFFMAIMPSHIERSPLGFSDHDAIVLFFVVTTFFFLAKSFNSLVDKRWIDNWKSPKSITFGAKSFFNENKIALGFALLCGFSIGVIVLMWKGFGYVMVIIAGYFIVQMIFNKFRRIDSFGIFVVIATVNITAMMISFPLAYQLGAGTWYNPFFILAGITIVGILFVPTRDYPWIIVLPTIAITVGLAYGLIALVFPEQAESLLSGGGYFIKSKLYSTIAEAQAPDLSRLVFSYGPVTFYIALIGLVLAIIAIPKNWNKDYLMITIWCALSIYMAISAVRFMFNASPVFAILTGWMIWMILEKVDPTLRRFKRAEAKMIYGYVGIVTVVSLFASLYITYSYTEQYAYFQYLFGLCALGIAMCLFGLYMTFRFHYYFTLILFGSFALIWLLFTWFRMEEIFYISLGLLVLVSVPLLLFIMFKYTASGVRIELTHIGLAVFLTFLILMPNAWFAVDSSIPYESKRDYDPQNQLLGAFGHSFVSEYWLDGMRWFSEQDNELPPEDRPGFVSWWDYGFWAIYLGQHPSVAENFQNGYHFAGSVIASQNETEAITLFSLRLIEADIAASSASNVKPIIIKYLDNGDMDNHPNWNRIYDAMRYPASYIDEVNANPDIYGNYLTLKPENTKYAVGKIVIMNNIGIDRLVEMLNELEEATKNSIRYFAVDSRLFPFSAQNTGIFYAPIKLADKDIDEYLEYLANAEYRLSATDDDWIAFPDNPLTTERLEEEIDTRGQELVRIMDWELKYTDLFYNSMFYRAFTGWHGADVGIPDDGIPGMNDGDETTIVDSKAPMQAWNMTHFKLAYKTLYWNPVNESTYLSDEDKYSNEWRATSWKEGVDKKELIESDGLDNNGNGEVDEQDEGGIVNIFHGSSVFFLKYYHGAFVQGYVKTAPPLNDPDAEGRAVPSARITVHDEFSIPHDVVYTDETGWFNITVPSGDISLWISKDGFDLANVDTQLLLLEKTLLNKTDMHVTEDQANREHNNYIIFQDLRVEPGSINGTIYWDKNGDDIYDTETEQPVDGIEVTLYDPVRINAKSELERDAYVLTSVTDENGFYNFDRIIPGTYKLETQVAGHNITFAEELQFTLDDPQTLFQIADYPVKPSGLKGMVEYFNGTPAAGVEIKVIDETNKKATTSTSLANGTYIFEDLLSGNYTMIIEETGFVKFDERVEVEQDFVNETLITLRPITPVAGYVWNDKDNDHKIDQGEELENARVTFFHHQHKELNTIMFSDAVGFFQGNLTAGNYTQYVKYQLGNNILAGTESVTIESQTHIQGGLNIAVGPAYMVSGVLTKLANDTVEGVPINFINNEDSTVVPAPTNLSGYYQAYLPPGDYTWRLSLIDLGTNYSYAKDFQLVDSNFELDLNVLHATLVNGTIYWDRNDDGVFTPYWFDRPATTEDHDHEDELTPPTRQGDEHEHELNETDPTLVKESLEGVVIAFTNENGTITARSNVTGVYETRIPAGEYLVTIDDPRFKALTTIMPEEALSFKVAPPAPTNPPPVRIDIELEPEPVRIKGRVWNDENGNGMPDMEEAVPDIIISFTNLSLGTQDYIAKTGSNGFYSIFVMPGVYDIQIEQLLEKDGIRYAFNEEEYQVPITGDGSEEFAIGKPIKVEKYIKVDYTVELDGSEISSEQLRSANTTLHIFDADENEIQPELLDDIPLGGYIKPGKYALWLEYYREGDNYVFLGDHDISSTTRNYDIELVEGVRINGTLYNDTSDPGVIDTEEWLSDVELKFTPAVDGGFIKFNVPTGLYSAYLQPDMDFAITVDSIRDELIDGKEVNARYRLDDSIKIKNITSLDLEATRFLNISGFLFYNVFETELDISADAPTSPGEIIEGGDLGRTVGNADIIFTEHPEGLEPKVSNAKTNDTGNYNIYLQDRVEYNIKIQRHGFDTKPVAKENFIVSGDNSTFNIQAEPNIVTVSGRIYNSETNGTIKSNVHLEFILNYQGVDTKYKAVNMNDGYYSIDLIPEKYTVYAYTEGVLDKTNISARIYKSFTYFDSAEFNISEDKTMDLGLVPGVKVYGIVSYTDSNDDTIYNVNQNNKDGAGIKVEAMMTDGLKYLNINNSDYWIYLPYGDYNFVADIKTNEFDMNMTYELDKIITVTNTTAKTNLELEKLWDYRFDFTLDRTDRVITIPDGTSTEFEFILKNNGNDKNTVVFTSPATPDGWVVTFESDRITLNITEERRITAVVQTVAGSYYDNTVDFKAESQNNAAIANTETMEIHIPAQYNYEFYTESPTTFGIAYSEVLEIPLAIRNLGNAGDSITIAGPQLPSIWNVTVEDPDQGEPLTLEALGDVVYQQNDPYKNLTLRITAPNRTTGHMIGEKISLNLFAQSRSGQKSQVIALEAILNLPDLKVLDFTISNLRLSEPGRNNITVNATITSAFTGVSNVPVALFIDKVAVANYTLARVDENEKLVATLSYELASQNKGEHTIQVVVDPDNVVEEISEVNNDVVKLDTIGPLDETDEVNWRPYMFLAGLMVFLLVFYIYTRWRRKI